MPRSRNTADILLSSINAEAGFLSGLGLSRSTTSVMAIAAGLSRNEDGGVPYIMQSAAFTKNVTTAWAVGTGNGALDTGAIAANTWYHVHQIRRDSDGLIDFLTSLSATAPTMPSGWTARRRIGSFRTDGSSLITNFFQVGNTFLWDVPVLDVNATNPGTAAVTRTLPSVPTGIVCFPIVAWNISNATTGSVAMLVTALAQTASTPSTTLNTLLAGAANAGATGVVSDIFTNTSAQIRTQWSVSGASDVLRGTTLGWIDLRGQG